MASPNRVEKLNGEIRRALSDILPTVKDPRISGLVTVVRVETSGDLSQCRVYVSAMDGRKDMQRGLERASGYIRRELSRTLSLRHVPELHFIADDSIREGARILGLLHSVEDEVRSEG